MWWQTGVIYQIYPRSFGDASGDGIGDLAGIEAHLDYVAGLGVDAIWLSPVFPSPMADFGYDIAEYTDIDPVFGTLEDLDRLVAAAHGRGIKLLLDLVPNHTSDEHAWFVESRASRDSAKRDWYLWRDASPGGGPPNNWKSFFGGPAWEWDPATGQYYLHLFHRKQPDLNWHNPDVRTAVYGVMRFWLDRGVDGFRLDAYWVLFKDQDYPDEAPPRPLGAGELGVGRFDHPSYEDRAEMRDVVREMRAITDEYDERVLIGELYLPLPRLMTYYGDQLKGLHLPFNFSLVTMTHWDAASVRRVIEAYEAALPAGAWPNWVLGNHDMPRVATRAGVGGAGPAGGRLAHMLLFTLRGTPTCYCADELGMPNGDVPPDRVVDPQAAAGRTRDVSRTPMPWDDGPNAGFCPPDVEPWLPITVPPDGSVARQDRDRRSSLALTRELLTLRRRSIALQLGTIELLDLAEPDVVAYVRRADDEQMLVALNFGPRDLRLDASAVGRRGQVRCSTRVDRSAFADLAELVVGPYEGVVVTPD